MIEDDPPDEIPAADTQELFIGDIAEDYRVMGDRLYATVSGVQDAMTEDRISLAASLFEELMFLEEGFSRCDIAFQTALELTDPDSRPTPLDEAEEMNQVVLEVSDSVAEARVRFHSDEQPWPELENAKSGVLTVRDWLHGMEVESVKVPASELQLGYVQFL